MSAYTLEKYHHHETGAPHSYTVYGEVPLRYLPQPLAGKRILDVGCGGAFWTDLIAKRGAEMIGIEPSAEGVAIARKHRPHLRIEPLPMDDQVLAKLRVEPFDGVISVEVVEHLYDPRGFLHACYGALRPGGTLVVTTPYHGYFKNVAIALSNSFDRHVNPLWDGGHVKFWSRKTLSAVLTEIGFTDLTFHGCGRAPYMWMGMVMSGKKPG
jgi:2-polyprenyl-6-hydroxyphenyl methylase/3-demethylubiquinone-9 3-methyltransferase